MRRRPKGVETYWELRQEMMGPELGQKFWGEEREAFGEILSRLDWQHWQSTVTRGKGEKQ